MRKVILIILDGFGLRDEPEGNAIKNSGIPNISKLMQEYPLVPISGSGEDVGLPDGIMGNSEVGHMNIGAGRVIPQDVVRISKAALKGELAKNELLQQQFEYIKEHNSAWHLIGLLSDGQVHSYNKHVYALLRAAKESGVEDVYVHCFMDGRDTSPTNGVKYLRELQEQMDDIGVGEIASVVGRYFAMDRDNRWDRTEKAYRLLVYGEGNEATNPIQAVKGSYEEGITDEFLKPIVVMDGEQPVATVKEHDAIFGFNYRADRMRQITKAFTLEHFEPFDRKEMEISYATMTQYDEEFDLPVAFPPIRTEKVLGEIIAEEGLKQLRISETEKYAHVTYFMNCGREEPFENEDRILFPSPQVSTYDLQPEMSSPELTERVLESIDNDKYSLIIMNFPNPDMVGHSGDIEATTKAVTTIDEYVGRIVQRMLNHDGIALITADHGNAEQLIDEHGGLHTAHTTNPVPFIVVDKKVKHTLREGGKLSDIAPTILKLMGIEQPEEMTGKSLVTD
ncbi:MAG: 2,3-bisphosphoglycerate-independent phosphoglycerate mutase [Candidatus Marinimicrobia bacterium]|nr:2,3-bisphosphoglycerate-independent phosphoglycerate mutase [Candidatus Neomarinimicrobiota bacterium]